MRMALREGRTYISADLIKREPDDLRWKRLNAEGLDYRRGRAALDLGRLSPNPPKV